MLAGGDERDLAIPTRRVAERTGVDNVGPRIVFYSITERGIMALRERGMGKGERYYRVCRRVFIIYGSVRARHT